MFPVPPAHAHLLPLPLDHEIIYGQDHTSCPMSVQHQGHKEGDRKGRATQKTPCGIPCTNALKWWSPETLGFLSPSFLQPQKITARGKPVSSRKMLMWYQEEWEPRQCSAPSGTTNLLSSPFRAPATATIHLSAASLRGLSLPRSTH